MRLLPGRLPLPESPLLLLHPLGSRKVKRTRADCVLAVGVLQLKVLVQRGWW